MIENSKKSRELTAFSDSVSKLDRARRLASQAERKRAIQDYHFPKASQRYEYALIFVNWVIAIGFGWQIGHELKAAAVPIWKMLLCVSLAFFIADLMSTGFHKWLGSYASELNPLWGSAAKAFRIHHEFPKNLNGATYWYNVSAFAPFMTFSFCLVFLLRAVISFAPCLSLTIELLIVSFSRGTEIHRQSHTPKSPAVIRGLQWSRIFSIRKRTSFITRGILILIMASSTAGPTGSSVSREFGRGWIVGCGNAWVCFPGIGYRFLIQSHNMWSHNCYLGRIESLQRLQFTREFSLDFKIR